MESWHRAWMMSRDQPLRFVTDVLGADPDPWQRQALEAMATHDRVAIRSGHGVGKTAFLAWVVLWYLLTRIDSRIPILANTEGQVQSTVWPEVARWRAALPPQLEAQVELTDKRISLRASPERAFAAIVTATRDRPEGLQGFHAPHLLCIMDEASGISEAVFNAMVGVLSTEGARLLMTGNPTRPSGFFFDAFHRLRERWWTLRVSCEDVPRAQGHIRDVLERSGRESNEYRIRVLGEFPTAADEQVIPLDLIEAAIAREVSPTRRAMVWGLDVARFGDDRCALAKRRGNVMLDKVKAWRNLDLMQSAGVVLKEWRETPDHLRPASINVDVIGLGAGVCDRLRELGLPARGVNVGEAPHDEPDRFMRLRDELWFKARAWFAARDCHMVDDPALVGELTSLLYAFSPTAKLKVESKDDAKKRGIASPDLADAFCLTFAGGDLAVDFADIRRQTAVQDWDPFDTGRGGGYGRQTTGGDWDPFA